MTTEPQTTSHARFRRQRLNLVTLDSLRLHSMWPFKKRTVTTPKMAPAEPILYRQLDITESFDDNLGLTPDDWIPTVPLNKATSNARAMGLPSADASEEEIYEVASKLSQVRESIPIPNDGVYCPICHIANIDLAKLRTPCPKCGRVLLKFGWD